MFLYGTRIGRLCYVVLATFFAVNFVSVSDAFFEKGFFASGNTLWDELYQKCGSRVSFYCVQNRLMNYINNSLDSDLRITDGIYFVKNNNDRTNKVIDSESRIQVVDGNSTIPYRRRTERASNNLTMMTGNDISNTTTNDSDPEQEEEEFSNFVKTVEKLEVDFEASEDKRSANTTEAFGSTSNHSVNTSTEKGNFDEEPRSDSLVIKSLNKVSDILYEKTSDYLASHDLRLDLPQTFFGGSRMIVSPRGFEEDGGILLKVNFSPAETPRHIGKKYFHKMFKKKLLTSFLALLLIIKLIKIKMMYVLPVIMSVHTGKKLLLKTLLFLFPPLVHLFKLCTYYHSHASKLHFHHHKIKHHHHHIKVPVPVPVPVPSKPHVHYDSHGAYDEAEGPLVVDHGSSSYPDNSYPSPEYYTRNDMTNQHADELASWGLKDFYASTESPGVLSAQAQAFSPFAEQNYKVLQAAASKPYVTTVKKNKGSTGVWKTKATNQASVKNSFLVPFDPFYSPILQKIDSIFTQLGFNEEGCRERLICSMYKNPVRFSPHSNLLSTELSRDPTELERPSQTNLAAVRFYRYVEAARDGQSQKECLALYPDCVVKTE